MHDFFLYCRQIIQTLTGTKVTDSWVLCIVALFALACTLLVKIPPSQIGIKSDSAFRLDVKEKLKHLAIIMDGNRRFGNRVFSNATEGHRRGADKLWEVLQWCVDLQIDFLSVFAFSTENWKRSKDEIASLLSILRESLPSIRRSCTKHRVIVRFLSTEPELIPTDIERQLRFIENKSNQVSRRKNKNDAHILQLNIFVSYGGRQEILHAFKNILSKNAHTESSLHEVITENLLSQNLLTANNGGDPDLVIRTSGESRISNFLLWQSAYSEFFIEDAMWPELSKKRFLEILQDFILRKRRYGK